MKNMTREQARMLSDALGIEYNKDNLMRFADVLMGFANPEAEKEVAKVMKAEDKELAKNAAMTEKAEAEAKAAAIEAKRVEAERVAKLEADRKMAELAADRAPQAKDMQAAKKSVK